MKTRPIKYRFNVWLPQEIRDALEKVQVRRYEEIGIDCPIQRLVMEGVMLLLHREGIVVRPGRARDSSA